MTKEEPFSATFTQEKETKNTVRYSEESERPPSGGGYRVLRQVRVAEALSGADSGND